MQLRQVQKLETALRRLEEARDRVGALTEETGDKDLARLTGLLSLDLGTLRGIIRRVQDDNS